MKRALFVGLLYGLGCGAACYLGYLFGYQEAELKNERALAHTAIETLKEVSNKNKDDGCTSCEKESASQE